MRYRSEIDGLRAFAVVPVIFFHAGFSLFSGGFIGVDVFFVISGYLITSLIVEDIENNRFSIISFYERRARRILPALTLVSFVCIPFAFVLLTPSELKDFSQSLVAVAFFSSNILFWLETDYFAQASELKPLLHTWSLAIEEQYYILFPMFMLVLSKTARNKIFVAIAIFAVISLVLAQWASTNYPSANFYLLPTRCWELFAGSIAALVVKNEWVKRGNGYLAALGFFSLMVPIFYFDDQTPFPSMYTLFPVAGTVFIILFSDERTAITKLLSWRPFIAIGLISYSMYLWHQPLFAFYKQFLDGTPNSQEMASLSAVAVALSYLSWKYVEVPFRNRSWISKRIVFIASPCVLTVLMTVGVSGHFTEGFRKLLLSVDQISILETASFSPKRSECHPYGDGNALSYEKACVYYGETLRVATFGDSHTVELAYSLSNELKKKGIALKQLSASGCVPSLNFKHGSDACREWMKASLAELTNAEDIQTVVVSFAINQHLFGPAINTYPALPKNRTDEEMEEIWMDYVAILKALVDAGKIVILVLQAPDLPSDIENMIYSEKVNGGVLRGVSKAWWVKRSGFLRGHVSGIPKAVTIVDPAMFLCDGAFCYAARDGRAYYFDDDHMSIGATNILAKSIVARMDGIYSQRDKYP